MRDERVSHLVILSFWMLLLLLFLAVRGEADTIVTIPAQIDVENSVLMLKDLAHIETDNSAYAQSLGFLRIGKAPSLGQTKRYNRSFFVTRLKQLRLDPAGLTLNIPSVVHIHRRSTKIDIQQLALTAKQAILSKMDYQGQEVQIGRASCRERV